MDSNINNKWCGIVIGFSFETNLDSDIEEINEEFIKELVEDGYDIIESALDSVAGISDYSWDNRDILDEYEHSEDGNFETILKLADAKTAIQKALDDRSSIDTAEFLNDGTTYENMVPYGEGMVSEGTYYNESKFRVKVTYDFTVEDIYYLDDDGNKLTEDIKFPPVTEDELAKRAKVHKKKLKGLGMGSLNPNAGNVEHNINVFNHANSPAEGPSVNPNGPMAGEMAAVSCCESLEDDWMLVKNNKWYDPEGLGIEPQGTVICRGTEEHCRDKFSDIVVKARKDDKLNRETADKNHHRPFMMIEKLDAYSLVITYPHAQAKEVYQLVKCNDSNVTSDTLTEDTHDKTTVTDLIFKGRSIVLRGIDEHGDKIEIGLGSADTDSDREDAHIILTDPSFVVPDKIRNELISIFGLDDFEDKFADLDDSISEELNESIKAIDSLLDDYYDMFLRGI